MARICFTRIHGKIRYTGEPLNHIMDVFYEFYLRFMVENPQHEYTFYNCSFDGSTPKRDLTQLEGCDIFIIPSENNFQYYIPGYFHTVQNKKWMDEVAKIEPYLARKKVILFASDRADNEELYREYTFPNIRFDFSKLDEDDFTCGLHGMKYHYIRDFLETFLIEPPKKYDFVYWGCDKRKQAGGASSGDERHKILKEIQKSHFDSFWIGRFANIKRDIKIRPMKEIIPYLAAGRYTLCFNWMSDTAITARYHEAMACGVIPLVWKNYDSTNRLVNPEEDFQRCHYAWKVLDLLDCTEEESTNWFNRIHADYIKKLPSPEQYYSEFSSQLSKILAI